MNDLGKLSARFQAVAVQDFSSSPLWHAVPGWKLRGIQEAAKCGVVVTTQRKLGDGVYELLAKLASPK